MLVGHCYDTTSNLMRVVLMDLYVLRYIVEQVKSSIMMMLLVVVMFFMILNHNGICVW